LAGLVRWGERRRRPPLRLPKWAKVGRRRRAHIRRVAALVEEWAEEMRVSQRERRRWLTAVWLHDALRDARLPDGVRHGAAAAERAAQEGEADGGVLDAVRYHSVGYAGWDDVGRMLYLADNLEPGRRGRRKERARLAKRVPRERDDVLKEVVARQMEELVRAGRPIDPLTTAFWNSLARR
jgi:HD superfamily phosphohydrolase YqeK